jgi:hypothetical protein
MGYLQYLLVGRTEQQIFEKVNSGVPIGKDLAKWGENAPGFNLHRLTAPVLISAFETGELLYEWETYSALRLLRKPVDMIWLVKGNAPHILVQPHQRFVSQQSAVDWFSFWLQGKERKDLVAGSGETRESLQDQYRRWEDLCREQVEQNSTRPAPCVRSIPP